MGKPIKSIKYPFGIDQGMGTLAEEHDLASHIRQMMIQVLMTNPGERINRPDFGCGIRSMVFAPNSDVTANLTHLTIVHSLETWLGSLITLKDVKVTANGEKLEVDIFYAVKAMDEPQYLNVELSL
jgi:hypothetical protein